VERQLERRQGRQRLTERERLLTEGSYYGSGAVIDRQRAAAAYEQLLEIDPTNSAALNNLGNIYRSRREFEKAEAVYRKAVASGQATSIAYGNLQATLFGLGKFAAQDSIATQMRRAFPNVPGQAMDDVQRLYYEGKHDSIRVVIDEQRAQALEIPGDLVQSLRLVGQLEQRQRIAPGQTARRGVFACQSLVAPQKNGGTRPTTRQGAPTNGAPPPRARTRVGVRGTRKEPSRTGSAPSARAVGITGHRGVQAAGSDRFRLTGPALQA
jgi:tetratricopeptide (TPR) repeat protein